MPGRRHHIESRFDAALNALRDDVLMMAGLSEGVLADAMDGLFRRDSDLCNRAIATDEQIDALEKEIDRVGVQLLIRFQPVASDLRRVISTMKLSVDLERVGDESVAIARRARSLNLEPAVPEVTLLEPLFREAKDIFRDSLHAFVEGEVELASKVKERDRRLDQLNRELTEALARTMATHPERIGSYLNLLFVGRSLERIGDHATNIAEDTIWAERAEDIRHAHPPKPIAD
jgi:phosphate transport system protein